MGFAAAAPYAIPAAATVVSGMLGKKAAKNAAKASESRPIYAPVNMVDDKGRPYTYYRLMGMSGGQSVAAPDMMSILGKGLEAGATAWGTGQLSDQRDAAARSAANPIDTTFNPQDPNTYLKAYNNRK